MAGISVAGISVAGVRSQDQKLLWWLGGAVVAAILLVSLLAPAEANNDPRPSTYNTAPAGAKAAYLTLERVGVPVERWTHPLDDLVGVDASHTTLVLLQPQYTALNRDQLAKQIRGFLERGGRVLTTNAEGALLLPNGSTATGRRFGKLCTSEPVGPGPLAAAGAVEFSYVQRWQNDSPEVRVEQRCGPDAVVVREPVGRGEAVWWSSPTPLTNARLQHAGDMRLLLASLGAGRTVLFDEALEDEVPSKWTAARGLPLPWLLGQAALVFGLLVFSFSRRRGPVRLPVMVPRSSPVEFAVNMGDLYEKAGATDAATEAARRRLERVLVGEARLGERVVQAGPEAIVEALQERFGGDWSAVGEHLREATEARGAHVKMGSALKLVQALGADAVRIRRATRPAEAAPGLVETVR